MLVPTVIIDRRGNVWSYQFGRLYADDGNYIRVDTISGSGMVGA